MWSWAARPLSRTLLCHTPQRTCSRLVFARQCGDCPVVSGVEEAAETRPSLHLDDPILADFLAMGGGTSAPALAAVEEKPKPLPAVAATSSRDSKRVPVGKALYLPERRLVAAALRPARALPQAPSVVRASRISINPVGLRSAPQRLPSLFERPVPAETEEPTHEAAASPTSSSTSSAPEEHPFIGRSHSAPATLRAAGKGVLRVPEFLRKRLCKALLGSFTQVTTQSLGLASNHDWQLLLTKFERDRAMALCEQGEILLLVDHLTVTGLHMEHGIERRALLRSGNRSQGREAHGSSQSLQLERREIAKNWNVASRKIAEETVVALYLDRRLSWPRIFALLNLVLLPNIDQSREPAYQPLEEDTFE